MQNKPDSIHKLNEAQGQLLIKLARYTLMRQLERQIPQAKYDSLEAALSHACFQRTSGVFVTLTISGQLRGCIGNLTSNEPLVSGVRRNAINAAFHDPRFAPLSASEIDEMEIEISILSEPRPLKYRDADDLFNKLRPNIDGVIVRKQAASATFVPQVWEQLTRPKDFLDHLCLKAGLASDAWQHSQLEVSCYQVQYFEEHTASS
jgi:AmmeMemoRadiSam system protein A